MATSQKPYCSTMAGIQPGWQHLQAPFSLSCCTCALPEPVPCLSSRLKTFWTHAKVIERALVIQAQKDVGHMSLCNCSTCSIILLEAVVLRSSYPFSCPASSSLDIKDLPAVCAMSSLMQSTTHSFLQLAACCEHICQSQATNCCAQLYVEYVPCVQIQPCPKEQQGCLRLTP